MTEGEPHPITRIFDAYKAAVYDKDVDAFVALYDPQVEVYDTWGAWLHDGLDAWRKMASGWFESLGTERVQVSFDDVRTAIGQDVAGAHAIVTYQALAADGMPLRAMQNRLTWTLRQSAGVWRIVHEHTSAPADFETAKLILQR